MKRDMELIREILLAVEAAGYEGGEMNVSDKWDDQLIHYNVSLMNEAGLLHAGVKRMAGGRLFTVPYTLTWNGHEYLDSIRDATLWAKTKQAVGASGGFSFEVLKATAIAIAISIAKKAAGLS